MIPAGNWQQQILAKIGAPVTPANLRFLELWARAEGGSAANNPFNTTQPASGASAYNSVGVRNYVSPQQGISATAQTLLNGRYGNLVGALRQGTSAELAAKALAASPWGTGSLVERMLGNSAAPGPAGVSVERSTGAGGLGGLPAPDHRAFALALLQPGGFSAEGLLKAFQARNATGEPPESGSAPLAPAGGLTAGDPQADAHDHGATLAWLRNFVKPFRVTITSTTEGQHAPHSFHYRARATDVSGSHSQMLDVANAALKRPHDFAEMFYAGADRFIKSGKVYPISQLDPALLADHRDHVHLAR